MESERVIITEEEEEQQEESAPVVAISQPTTPTFEKKETTRSKSSFLAPLFSSFRLPLFLTSSSSNPAPSPSDKSNGVDAKLYVSTPISLMSSSPTPTSTSTSSAASFSPSNFISNFFNSKSAPNTPQANGSTPHGNGHNGDYNNDDDEEGCVVGAHDLSFEERKGKIAKDTKWQDIISRFDVYQRNNKQVFRKYFVEGVPEQRRAFVWRLVLNTQQFSRMFGKGVYQRLLEQEVEDDYQIIKDLHRTLPEHPHFARGGPGQQSLYNLMRAYCAYDQELGYVQGMAFLASILLLVMKDEEETFWSFVQLMFVYRWRDVFGPGTPRLLMLLYKVENLILHFYPDLHAHLVNEEVSLQTCAAQWFITIFVYKTPLHLTLRLWDLFLLEGEEALLKTVLVMLDMFQVEMMEMEFQDLVPFYMSLPEYTSTNVSVDSFVRRIADVRLDVTFLRQLEKTFISKLKKKEKKVVDTPSSSNNNNNSNSNSTTSGKDSSANGSESAQLPASAVKTEDCTSSMPLAPPLLRS